MSIVATDSGSLLQLARPLMVIPYWDTLYTHVYTCKVLRDTISGQATCKSERHTLPDSRVLIQLLNIIYHYDNY